jgi:hypothetical protein
MNSEEQTILSDGAITNGLIHMIPLFGSLYHEGSAISEIKAVYLS